ncbi:CIA30 family protein [Pendulispora brunnea]|uniref:CIA30 family protein n=1 Tax=Pendulispora brunnea TaxID=2905690 RepID=A0ABZ2K4I5_9BACT
MRAPFLLALLPFVLCACTGQTQVQTQPPAPIAPPQHATLAIRDVRVFDGQKVVTSRATVLVDGERIVAIGENLSAPPGAEVVDGAGKTLLPGLIDAHVHVFDSSQLEQSLAFGVTTVLDMFAIPDAIKELRSPRPDRAEIRSAGILATAPGGHGTEYGFEIPTLDRPDQAQDFVDARIAEGSDYIKIVLDDGSAVGRRTPTLSNDTVVALVKAAHARGKMAVVHVHSLETTKAVLAAGADGVEHIFADRMPPEGFAAEAAKHKAFVTPTLAVMSSVYGRKSTLEKDEALAPYLMPAARRQLQASFPLHGIGPAGGAAGMAAVKQLEAAGVPILAGTDAPNPGTAYGVSMHDELALLVSAGLTPSQALEAATSAPARSFALSDRGRIAPGLRADLLLVDGDPTADILATRRIVGVWHAGARLDRDAVRAKVATALSTASAAPIAAAGPVSDFESGTLATRFGQPWVESSDKKFGGNSTVVLNVEKGALRLRGQVAAGNAAATWAGALLTPGGRRFEPVDVSKTKGLAFRVRGSGKGFSVLLFTQRHGFAPLEQTFTAGAKFTRVTIPWSKFEGTDGSDVTAIFIGGTAPGTFDLAIDDVEIY